MCAMHRAKFGGNLQTLQGAGSLGIAKGSCFRFSLRMQKLPIAAKTHQTDPAGATACELALCFRSGARNLRITHLGSISVMGALGAL